MTTGEWILMGINIAIGVFCAIPILLNLGNSKEEDEKWKKQNKK